MIQWLSFKAGLIVGNKIKHLRLEDKETAVDPAFSSLWFLRELFYAIAAQHQSAEACWWSHRRDRSQAAMAMMEGD